jgi:4-hydroxy-tetrahydrodipicolinate synthase
MSERIRGLLAPVVTPFHGDLSPDPERLIEHCRWLTSRNCGLAVFGTNSEANSMSADERIELLDALVAAGIDPARMMSGTGCCSITETVRLSAHAVKQGCAGVLMLPPFYYKQVSEDGLFHYFSEVVQRVGDARLRIYLYHIPPVAIVGITPRLVERLLAAYPGTVAGMKDSSGDWNNTKAFLDAFSVRSGSSGPGASPDFDVFVGSDSLLLANMRGGGAGCISATANVNPAAIHNLYAEFIRRNCSGACVKRRKEKKALGTNASTTTELQDQQTKLDVVRRVFANRKFPSMIAALKQAIAIYRNDAEWARVRPPLVQLNEEQSRELEAELKQIGFAQQKAPAARQRIAPGRKPGDRRPPKDQPRQGR